MGNFNLYAMLKKILIALTAIFVVIQFFRPEKNDSYNEIYAVSTKYDLPNEVDQIFKVACYDCHSNKTEYPWYANVQPVAWWLDGHITNGKRHLNFSEFTNRSIAIQNHKFEEIIEEVKEQGMPLESYTYMGLHPDANLTGYQRELIVNWASEQMAYLKANYPADSLVMKRRRPQSED